MVVDAYVTTGSGRNAMVKPCIISPRSPTTSDTVAPDGSPWQIGQEWYNNITATFYKYESGGIWITLAAGSGTLDSLTGDTGTALPSAGNIKISGTANQITSTASGATVTLSLPATVSVTNLTAAGTVNLNATGAGVTTIGTGGTGAVNIGNATGNTAVTGSLTASTTLTATAGAITASAGGFVAVGAGNGITFPVTVAGPGATPQVCNGRVGSVTFSSVSIAAGATQTLVVTNSAVTGSGTVVLYTLRGATSGAAASIQSVTNSGGSSSIVVTNGTGATTQTGNLTFDFIVLN